MGLFDKGANDKHDGKGQVDPNKFKNDADRKAYQSGYDWQKKQQEQQKKQK